MGFRYFFFCILLFYNSDARVIEVECPNYCVCDIINEYRRATCQNKKIVTVEIGISPLVEYLDLSHNQISELGSQVFSNLQLADLKLLNLSYNKISQIDLYAFEGLEHLKSLDLSYNVVQYFLDQWWLSLSNLRELYLRGNNLASINNQPPISLPHLKVLDLSDNKVENFHTIVFKNLPSLEILDISDNFLINLRVELIRPLTNLRLLVANKNSLDCEDRAMSLLRQYIKENDMTYVGPCSTQNEDDTSTTTSTDVPKFERMMSVGPQIVKKDLSLPVPNLLPKLSNRIAKSNPIPQLDDDQKNDFKTDWKRLKLNKDIEDAVASKKKLSNSWKVDNSEFQKVGIPSNGKLPSNCNLAPPNPDDIKIHSFGSFFKYLYAKIRLTSPGGAAVLSGVCGLIIGVFAGQTKTGQAITRKIKVMLKKFSPMFSKTVPFFPKNNDEDGSNGDKKDQKGKRRPRNKDKGTSKKKKRKNIDDEEKHLTEDVDDSDDDDGVSEALSEDCLDTKQKSKKGSNKVFDDQTYLLDEEEIQADSTPAMRKKSRAVSDSRSKKESAPEGKKSVSPKEHARKKKKYIWETESEGEESGGSEEKTKKPKRKSSPPEPSSRSQDQADISVTERDLEDEETTSSARKGDDGKRNE